MSDQLTIIGTVRVAPSTLTSGSTSTTIPIDEKINAVRKNGPDDYVLTTDATVEIPFGPIDAAHVVTVFADRPVTLTLVSVKGAASVPIDGHMSLISETYPFSAVSVARDTGVETKVSVMLGQKLTSSTPAAPCANHPDLTAIQALMGDIEYWSRDLYEHCIFHAYAITGDAALLARAQTLAFPGGGVTVSWADFIAANYPGGAAAARALAVLTRDLEQDIYDKQLTPNGWTNWLYPGVYSHCVEEAQTYVDTVDDKQWTANEARTLALKWNKEHAANLEHFIDGNLAPAQATQARAFRDTFARLEARSRVSPTGCDCELDAQAIEAGLNFNAFLDSLHIGEGAPAETPSTLIALVPEHMKFETTFANAVIAACSCS